MTRLSRAGARVTFHELSADEVVSWFDPESLSILAHEGVTRVAIFGNEGRYEVVVLFPDEELAGMFIKAGVEVAMTTGEQLVVDQPEGA